MCLALISTAHPQYPFILLSNRDEFFKRPTLRASFWSSPHSHVLAGRDLEHHTRGTWLGITRQGRIAVLTNFREEDLEVLNKRSRGEITKMFLEVPPESPEDLEGFARRLVEDDGFKGVGGFSLIFGELKKQATRLGIVGNRMRDLDGVIWIGGTDTDSRNQNHTVTFGQTCALSNSHYGDNAWPKVVNGERLLKEAVEVSKAASETTDRLLERLFALLSTDSLPDKPPDEPWITFSRQLRKSIFIPNKGDSYYGTQQQTVILVDREGHVTFVERTLYDKEGREMDFAERDKRHEFDIEGWNE